MAVAIFCNEVKGKSMLALSRDLGTQYKTAFVLAHKMREAMACEVRQTAVGGEGKRAEIDGGYFGGYVKPANRRENRRDRRLRVNQSGKRKVVVVIRERGGRTLPGVFRSEIEARNFIRRQVPQGTTLYADEAGSRNELHSRYELHRINHQEAYSLGGEYDINTNAAEGYFSRLRRGEIGHHHPRPTEETEDQYDAACHAVWDIARQIYNTPAAGKDASGECRFDTYEVPLTLQDAAPPAAPFYIANPVDATRYIFFRIPPGWVGDLHPAPNPRLVICLSGSLRFVGSKGAFCILRAGDRLLDVNTTGDGHVTEVVSDDPVDGIIIRLD